MSRRIVPLLPIVILLAVLLWNLDSVAYGQGDGIIKREEQKVDSLLQGSAQIIGANLSLPPDLRGAPLSVLPMVSFVWHADGTLTDVDIRRTAPFFSPVPVQKFEELEDSLRAAVLRSSPLRRGPFLSEGTYNAIATYDPRNPFRVSLQLNEIPIEELQEDLVRIPGEAMMPVPKGVLLGFIDAKGNMTVRPSFLQARSFSNGMAAVRASTGWGAIDKNGAMVVRPVYSFMGDLSDGRLPVVRRGLAGYLDSVGRTVVEPNYSECGRFSEGLAPVKLGQSWGYIDTAGNSVIRPQFDSAGRFFESRAAVRTPPGGQSRSGPEGYIDRFGRFVIPPSFAVALDFHDGMATVASQEFKFFAVNESGVPAFRAGLLPPWESFHEGLARTIVGSKIGYVDTKGNTAISPQFAFDEGMFPYTGWFSEGLAAVKVGDRYGYIDKMGKMKISPRFSYAGPFQNQLAPARVDKAFGYIDHEGRFVVQPSFAIAYPFAEGRALVGVRAGEATR
jgi:hypothetical protein